MFQIADEQTYEDGQIIWEEGTYGDWVYVILSGKVELSRKIKGEKLVMDVLRKDDILGELEFIVKTPRILTAQALGLTTLGIIDLEFLSQEYNKLSSNIKTILHSLAARIKKDSENPIFGREFPRIAKVLSLTFKSQASLVNAFSGNVSGNGMFIKTPKPLPVGEQFSMKLLLPNDPEPLQIDCEVAWNRKEPDDMDKQPAGMGVKFVKISDSDQRRLDNELKRMELK
jgi:uncharacterized protein (TIGR02266 family)